MRLCGIFRSLICPSLVAKIKKHKCDLKKSFFFNSLPLQLCFVWKQVLLESYLIVLSHIMKCSPVQKTMLLISWISVCTSPRLIDMGKVYRQTNLENLEHAFNVAEKDLGVTRLLDPEGMTDQSSPKQKPEIFISKGTPYNLIYHFRCWRPAPWWEIHHHLRVVPVWCHASHRRPRWRQG